MKNDPKFNILEKMIYNQNDYFDKDVCLFLLQSIKAPHIKEKEIQDKSIKNFNFSSNLWGQIIYENKNLYRMETSANDYAQLCQTNKTVWENILNSIDSDITQEPFYTLTKKDGIQKGKKHEVSINGMLALTEPDLWFTLYTKDPDKYQLTKKEKYLLCNDFEYQRYGKGKDEEDLALPFIVANPVKFHLISPDGKDFETDLIARADYMENMQ